jgi:hypothetical protein
MSRCTVTMITRLDHPRRGVALLEYPLPYVNAKAVFDRMVEDRSDRHHQKSFDYWLGGHDQKTERFHGFNKGFGGTKKGQQGKYIECFTFKDIGEKERFYGFLFHPKPDDERYQLCVLVIYVQKKEDAVDMAQLDRVNTVRKLADVQTALRDPRLFNPDAEGKGVGKNYE